MADITTLTQMQPGTVAAYGDILKTILPFIAGLNPIVSGVGIAASIVMTLVVNRNTKKTIANTSVQTLTADAVAAFKLDVEKIKKSLVEEIAAETKKCSDSISASAKEMSAELDKMKVVFIKVKLEAEAKLARIPIDELRLQKVEGRLNDFWQALKKSKDQKDAESKKNK